VGVVRVEGVPFELDDAAEFARRAKASSAGASKAGLSARAALAIQIEECVSRGGGDAKLEEQERVEALGVIEEWLQYEAAPKAALDNLRCVLASR
jgi:hypothetical protein